MNFFKKIVGMINKDDEEFIEEEDLKKLNEITKSSEKVPKIEREEETVTNQNLETFNAGIYIPTEDEFFGPEKTDEMFKSTSIKEETEDNSKKIKVTEEIKQEVKSEIQEETKVNTHVSKKVEKQVETQIKEDEFDDDFSFSFFGGEKTERKTNDLEFKEKREEKEDSKKAEIKEKTETIEKQLDKENNELVPQEIENKAVKEEIKPKEKEEESLHAKKELVKEFQTRSAFSLREKVREDFKEDIMKRFSSGSSASSSSSLSSPIRVDDPKPATTKKDEELIKERLYGDHLLKKKEEIEEKNKQMFGNIDQKVTRVNLEKVNSFLEMQREKIYQFMETKINNCYSSIQKENNNLQTYIKEIEENRHNTSLEGMRNKTKILTELTLIINKFITPKTRGLKRVKQYYQAIQLSCKEYESFVERYDIKDFYMEIEKVTESIQKIKSISQGLNEVFSLKKVDELDNLQQEIENIHAKIQLKNKIVKEIERRRAALDKFNSYKINMNKQNDKLVHSDGFRRFTDMRANQDSLIKELQKLNDKIVDGFNMLKDEIFKDMDLTILTPILKLYLKNCSETIKNDLNKELLQHLKRHMELNPDDDHLKIKSLMSVLEEYYKKNDEFKDTSTQINSNSIMQDQLDLDYKQSHIIEKEYKIKQELQKLEIAYNKLNINFEKAKLSKEISDKFNVNFLIN